MLQGIFENKEIYTTIEVENNIDTLQTMSGQTFMTYKGPSRVKLFLKVKQRKFDFINCSPKWDEVIIMNLIKDSGAFISRRATISPYDDMVSHYEFHIFNMDEFNANVTKYSEKLYNDRFAKELEDKLSED